MEEKRFAVAIFYYCWSFYLSCFQANSNIPLSSFLSVTNHEYQLTLILMYFIGILLSFLFNQYFKETSTVIHFIKHLIHILFSLFLLFSASILLNFFVASIESFYCHIDMTLFPTFKLCSHPSFLALISCHPCQCEFFVIKLPLVPALVSNPKTY